MYFGHVHDKKTKYNSQFKYQGETTVNRQKEFGITLTHYVSM